MWVRRRTAVWAQVTLLILFVVNAFIPMDVAHGSYHRSVMWAFTAVVVADSVSRWAMRSKRRRAAESWPTAVGTVESTTVESSRDLLPGKRLLRADYSYRVDGHWYSGFDERTLKEAQAEQESSRLRGSPVQVRYNPQKPSDSLLLDQQPVSC
jgi:hypothetical protein